MPGDVLKCTLYWSNGTCFVLCMSANRASKNTFRTTNKASAALETTNSVCRRYLLAFNVFTWLLFILFFIYTTPEHSTAQYKHHVWTKNNDHFQFLQHILSKYPLYTFLFYFFTGLIYSMLSLCCVVPPASISKKGTCWQLSTVGNKLTVQKYLIEPHLQNNGLFLLSL